ncbi:hypothetical protein FEM48_Zijuj06G0083000 [Ziziphus jujuba var. spinosa]|uniref:Uncharacterized protein n=1 Tax=Ziziphus jujuba var. spinosa TaxID=714518 RepID=A0A978V864_ZIZJJ|nr:hypothetical protein FEM48_Zijuj06G0083000 [Ziziphus jujuba var. spinosa]
MATNKAFVVIFLLVLVFSSNLVLGEESPVQNAAEAAKGAASDAVENVKETTSSWGGWLKDKFEDLTGDSDKKEETPSKA